MKISYIIVLENGAGPEQEALECLKMQGLPENEWEAVFVNAGGDAGQIMAARNAGMRKAGGDAIMFLRGQDWPEPGLMQALIPIYEASRNGIAIPGQKMDLRPAGCVWEGRIEDALPTNLWMAEGILISRDLLDAVFGAFSEKASIDFAWRWKVQNLADEQDFLPCFGYHAGLRINPEMSAESYWTEWARQVKEAAQNYADIGSPEEANAGRAAEMFLREGILGSYAKLTEFPQEYRNRCFSDLKEILQEAERSGLLGQIRQMIPLTELQKMLLAGPALLNAPEQTELFLRNVSLSGRKAILERMAQPEEEQTFPYRLSIALIARNESRHIREWIEYYRMLGVDHFYICDHASTDSMREVLRPYEEQGIVSYERREGVFRLTQLRFYNDTLKACQYETKYLAFLDSDEYLMPVEDRMLPDVVEEIFADAGKMPFRWKGAPSKPGGIGVNWRCYGTSGYETEPEGLLTENFCRRGRDELSIHAHIKTICNPRAVDRIESVHFACFKEGYHCISENGSYIPWAFFYDGTCRKLRLNHYYCRSEEEFERKRKNGDRPANAETIACMEASNEIYDDCMLRYAEELKKRLGL